MHRIYVETGVLDGGPTIRVEGEEAHHALRVRRAREGDALELFDGAGAVTRARLAGADGRGRWLEAELSGPVARHQRAVPRVAICSAVPKGDRVSSMIDQLSQLGVASWRPLNAERSVVEPRGAKLDRLRRVAIEAAKQSGRAWVMQIGESCTLGESLDAGKDTAVFVCDGAGGPAPSPSPGAISVIVGPEGGLTEGELSLAAERGARAVRLGPHTMRIETAAVAAGALLMRDATSPAPGRYTSEEVEA